MDRLISPPRDQLQILRTPLTAGEKEVFELFDQLLPPAWEIYIQPHLNGLRPDFILLNPNVGIAVFEVKDWNLDAVRYWHERDAQGRLQLWSTNNQGRDYKVRDNPIEKIRLYKDQILDLFCPRLGIQVAEAFSASAVITGGVIMTRATTKRARELLDPFLTQSAVGGNAAPYHPIAGNDALKARAIDKIFPDYKRPQSIHMDPSFADDLRSWLCEPDHASAQREPLPLNDKQRRLATTRPERGYRRIKGPAGSGKSLVLSARAAQLAMEGKDVLVVTYNITLLHYLRDLAVRYPQSGHGFTNRITWLHFHRWCKQVCVDAGAGEEYKSLRRNRQRSEDPDDGSFPASALARLVGQVIDSASDKVRRFDAILVDEGQDFNLDWWNVLRKVLRPGGEMLLVADRSQDIYGRARAWTDVAMNNAGFRGIWAELPVSYRLPEKFVPLLRRYVQEHLPEIGENLPEAIPFDPPSNRQLELPTEPVKFRWIQVQAPEHAVEACAWAFRDTQAFADPWHVSVSDITLLTTTINQGLECVEALHSKNIRVVHTFDEDWRKAQRLKHAFFMGDARAKACTIHSFKGWESRALIVLVASAKSVDERALVYVAMTRLKRHSEGSVLTVVCSAPELEAFGKTWPNFQYYQPHAKNEFGKP